MYKTKNRFWQPKGIVSQEFSKVWVNYTRITNLNKEDQDLKWCNIEIPRGWVSQRTLRKKIICQEWGGLRGKNL